jgi:LPXTG-site transpeptidase (sortase) family protein
VRRALSALLGLVAVGLIGFALLGGGQATTASTQTTVHTPAPLPEPRLVRAAQGRPGTPEEVRIPRLGVAARVLPVATRGDGLVPPSDPTELGWWAEGARPGDPGRALVAGHTVNAGGGALDDLETLERGDRVVVGSRGDVTRWVVDSVEVLGKGEIARRAEQLFTQEGPARLVLLTCEDWDGSAYRSNVVVVARPA